MDWVNGVGTIMTLAALLVTIVQVYKTKDAAAAAKKSADQASNAVKRSLVLSDLSKCSVSLNEVKSHILTERYEAALHRLNDVIAQLMQIRAVVQDTPGIDFRRVLPYLRGRQGIRANIMRQISQPSDQFNPIQTLKSLDIISDEVNGWVGHLLSPEETDADS